MNPEDILLAFGFKLRRPYAGWFVAEPSVGSAYFRYTGRSKRELVEMIVPRPPAGLSPETIMSWADECLTVAYGEPDPQALAKAAFAAYGLPHNPEALNIFADAVRAWKRE